MRTEKGRSRARTGHGAHLEENCELGDWAGKPQKNAQSQKRPDVLEEWKWGNPVLVADGIICTGESTECREANLPKGVVEG